MKDLKENGMSPTELDAALDRVELDLSSSMIPFMLLGKTLETAREGQVAGDKIEVGVCKRYLNKSSLSLLRGFVPGLVEEPGKMSYMVGKVPVEIKVIHRKYAFFHNPDIIYYKWLSMHIPNPVKGYLKARYLVK